VEHRVTFQDVVNRLMNRYREDVLNEIAEDVEKFVEMKVLDVIRRRATECAGMPTLYEDDYYRPEFRKCFEKITREVIRE